MTTANPDQPGARPGTARDHVTRLRELGGTYRAIAAVAGVGPMTVHDIATGRRPATVGTTAALLAVTSDNLPRGRLDAGGTRLRLRALQVMGHSSARIARATGASEKTIRKLVRGDVKTVSPQLHDTITTVYDAWWDKRPPQRTRAERTAAASSRRRAITGNWCAGAALDDDQLDLPGYQPDGHWRPAEGTGVAADIYSPAQQRQSREQEMELEA